MRKGMCILACILAAVCGGAAAEGGPPARTGGGGRPAYVAGVSVSSAVPGSGEKTEGEERGREKEERQSDPDDEALASLLGQAEGADLHRAVNEAGLLLHQASTVRARGDDARARRLYTAAFRRIFSVPWDERMHTALTPPIEGLYGKLEEFLRGGGREKDRRSAAFPVDESDPQVQKYLRRFSRSGTKATIQRALERGGRYREMIVHVLREYDLPEDLVYLPVIESFYDIEDRSSAGAAGLWQLMPERARDLGLTVNSWVDERKDPERSTRAAARYLRDLYVMFDDWPLALAAYNRGEYGMRRTMEKARAGSWQEVRCCADLPVETREFVPQFMACVLIGREPAKYGFSLRPEPALSCDKVVLSKSLDLRTIAQCAGISMQAIRELNPALTAWCTPRNPPQFELRLPRGTRKTFLTNLARISEAHPLIGCIRYRVAKGDCLGYIARRFDTTIREIRLLNRIGAQAALRENQLLVIHPGRRYLEEDGDD